jgi:hypothetical protein
MEMEGVYDEALPMDDVVAQEIAPLMQREQVSDGRFRWELPKTVSDLQPRLHQISEETVGGRLLKQAGMQLSAAYGKSEQLRAQRAAWEKRAEREVRKRGEIERKMADLQARAEAGNAELEALRSKFQEDCRRLQEKADRHAARLMQHSVDANRRLDEESKLRGEAEEQTRLLKIQVKSVDLDLKAAEEEVTFLNQDLAEARNQKQQLEEKLQEERRRQEGRSGLQADLWEAKEENKLLHLQINEKKAQAEKAERENRRLREENKQLAASAEEARRRMDELRRKARQTVVEKEQAEQQALEERKAAKEAETRASQAEEAARKAMDAVRHHKEELEKKNAVWIEEEQKKLRRTFAIQTANYEKQMEELKAAGRAARNQDVTAMSEEVRRVSALLKDTQQLLLESKERETKLEEKAAEMVKAWSQDQQSYEDRHDELVSWGEAQIERLTKKANRQAVALKEAQIKIAKLEKRPAQQQTLPPPPPPPVVARQQREAEEVTVEGLPLSDVLRSQAQQMASLREMMGQIIQGQERPPTTQQPHLFTPAPPPPSSNQERVPSLPPTQQPERVPSPAPRSPTRRSPVTTVEAVARAARPIHVEEFKGDTSITAWIEETEAAARGRSWTEMRVPIQKALGTQRVTQIKAWHDDGLWPASFQELEEIMRKAFGPGDGAEQERRFKEARRGGMTYTQYVSHLIQLARRTKWPVETALRNIREKLPEILQDKMFKCTKLTDLLPIAQQYDEIYVKATGGQVQAVHQQEHSKLKCYRCGKEGHTSKYCKSPVTTTGSPSSPSSQEASTKARCYRCGETGHLAARCRYQGPVCYTCKQPGHQTSQCQTRNPPTAQPAGGQRAESTFCMACGAVDHLAVNCKVLKDLQKTMTKASKKAVRQVQQEADFPLGEKDQTSQ